MPFLWNAITDAWGALGSELEARDWIDLVIALSTLLLAIATFRLAGFAERTARDSASALEAFRKQASATEALAENGRTSLEEQRETTRVQLRSHVIWLDSEIDDSAVTDDPRTWSSGESGGTAIRIPVKVRNLSSIPAYLERVDHPGTVALAVIDTPYVAGGAEGALTLYIPAPVGQRMELEPAPLRLHYQSTASGEARTSDALLHIWATIVPKPGDIDPAEYMISGQVLVTAEA